MSNTKIVKSADKRKPPRAGMGRPKGALNKTTTAAKDAIALAFEGLGGTQRLIDWAKEEPENERAFWTSIYPKLLPLQVNGELTSTVTHRAEDLTDDQLASIILNAKH
jgi:hypothetical protein